MQILIHHKISQNIYNTKFFHLFGLVLISSKLSCHIAILWIILNFFLIAIFLSENAATPGGSNIDHPCGRYIVKWSTCLSLLCLFGLCFTPRYTWNPSFVWLMFNTAKPWNPLFVWVIFYCEFSMKARCSYCRFMEIVRTKHFSS